MAEWLFNGKGFPSLIWDGNMVRNSRGYVIGWVHGPNLFSSRGTHIGWLEGGVFYDIDNCPLLFCRNHTGYLPTKPGLTGASSMPGFASPTGKPGFQGTRVRPGLAQRWSTYDPIHYFE
jgi:hypothetical protein